MTAKQDTNETIYQEYLRKVEELKRKHIQEQDDLEEELKQNQTKCDPHIWEWHEDLFYALGQTAPGEKCAKCGLSRHPQPKPSAWSSLFKLITGTSNVE